MPTNVKKTGYTAITAARHLIFERGELTRMGQDGRLDEYDAIEAAKAVDAAIEIIFQSWLEFKSTKKWPRKRNKWDRTKWEKRLIRGQAREPYASRYLKLAELHEDGFWDSENFGDE